MEKFFLQFDQSAWWILFILLLSFGLTWFLYSIRNPAWNRTQNWILSGMRFLAIFFSLALLLEPFVNQTIIRTEYPIVAIALDNSQSVIARSSDSLAIMNEFQKLKDDLTNEGISVRTFYLADDDTLQFDQSTTNISRLQQKVENEMEGSNWAATVWLTDGIFNTGSTPLYHQYPVPQFSIGLGDTIPPRDINISRVRYNRVSFKGNETPIQVEASQKGFDGQEVTFNLTENGNVLEQRKIRLDKPTKEFEFILKLEKEGLRKIEISTPIRSGESVEKNNQSSVFLEVIDGRQKVLIVAHAPHPDIRSIRTALDLTDNYQVDLYISSITESRPTDIYDVVIYHGAFTPQTSFDPKGSPGVWHILGEKSSLNLMNKQLTFLNIRKRGSQMDNVTSSPNQSFSKFNLSGDQDVFENFPPISIPFGDYILSGPTEVLLYQRVGSIRTKKPLFTFFDDGSQKVAILAGQNIWKWRLQESAISGNSIVFDNIISKTVQFLSVKNDKQQFRFRTRDSNFSNLQSILFESEVYNDIYERIYGNRISLKLSSENGETEDYEFIDSEYNSSFSIPSLNSGIYTYNASVEVGEKTFTDKGQFLVEEVNKEYLNLTADHNLLKSLAIRTEGDYVHFSEADQLIGKLKARNFKSIISSSESYFPLIQSRWMLLIILLLFSSEWLVRKYLGGY